MERQGGRKQYKTAKILLACASLILLAALIIGMAVRSAQPDQGRGAAAGHSQSYQAMAKGTGEHLNGVVSTAAEKIKAEADAAEKARKLREEQEAAKKAESQGSAVSWNDGWTYAKYSKIHTGQAVLYKSAAAQRKEITVAVNAGHGTKGGTSVRTPCHPDGSPKVTDGSTAAGETTAAAVSAGTTLDDGTNEAAATLAAAQAVKKALLAAGYDVLMLRDGKDVQLDNIARTVMANNNADCHISIHYDSTQGDRGFFYISVPNSASYRNMEPVASHWKQHNALGEQLLAGARAAGLKIRGSGSMAIDLTQTSYSTIPSVDVEVGDRSSDRSAATLDKIARAVTAGVDSYF